MEEKEIMDKVNNIEEISEVLLNCPEVELDAALKKISDEKLTEIFAYIDSDEAAKILISAKQKNKQRIISAMNDRKLKEVMDEIPVENTVEMSDSMPDYINRRILENDEIIELCEERKFATLKPLLSEKNPVDLAIILESIPEKDLALVFRILPKELAAQTFVEMESDLKELLINLLNDSELKGIMDELFSDDTVDLIEEMPANVVKRIIAQSDDEMRGYINELLNYPKNSAGSIMTIEFVSLKKDMSIKNAFDKIRKQAIDKETIYTCYVTDETKKLIGVVTAKDLMLGEPEEKISEIMQQSIIYADTHMDKEDAAKLIEKYGFLSIPVVDQEGRIVGIVTVDDAMDILQEENTEDISKMAAVTPSDIPYLKTSVFRIWANRIPWLLILMITATFTGMIITKNEELLDMPIYGITLMACIPMLMDSGGNAGGQASATIIRGMALNEITFKDAFKVLWKEIRAAVLLGLTLAVGCLIKLLVVDRVYEKDNGFLLASVICMSLCITIIVSKFMGSMLPILAKKCKLDPAVVASPIITTIVDIVSLLIYCGIATTVLGNL